MRAVITFRRRRFHQWGWFKTQGRAERLWCLVKWVRVRANPSPRANPNPFYKAPKSPRSPKF